MRDPPLSPNVTTVLHSCPDPRAWLLGTVIRLPSPALVKREYMLHRTQPITCPALCTTTFPSNMAAIVSASLHYRAELSNPISFCGRTNRWSGERTSALPRYRKQSHISIDQSTTPLWPFPTRPTGSHAMSPCDKTGLMLFDILVSCETEILHHNCKSHNLFHHASRTGSQYRDVDVELSGSAQQVSPCWTI